MIILPEDKAIVELLCADDAHQLLLALFSEDEPELSPLANMAYTAIKTKSDRLSATQTERGRAGGIASAEARKRKYGTALPLNAPNDTEQTPNKHRTSRTTPNEPNECRTKANDTERAEASVTDTVTDTVTVTEPYVEIYSPAEPSRALVAEIISHLNNSAGTRYKASAASTTRHINARLNEGYKLDDFIKVIDTKCAEWLNTDMAKYLRPETLFGSKFESYLNQPGRQSAGDIMAQLYAEAKAEEALHDEE